mmetsp:Transcript_25773/g.57776  ORF Transcript_25773/g.57776 Transcript_25773/m.57776 type:complete len:92 (+) Transcript_25773:294-569(+)
MRCLGWAFQCGPTPVKPCHYSFVCSPSPRTFCQATGKKTPTTDEVCDALNAIKEAYPRLEATDMAALLRQKYPMWVLDNLNWVELQERLDM